MLPRNKNEITQCMKNLFSTIVFFLIPSLLFSIEYDKYTIQGLKSIDRMKDSKPFICFEINGYDIFIVTVSGDLQQRDAEKTIVNKYKKMYKLENNYYLFQKNEKEVDLYVFQTPKDRDRVFEERFMSDYRKGLLDQYISEDWAGEYLNFFGREIDLGNLCEWKFPHCFTCDRGQINWTVSPTPEEAEIILSKWMQRLENEEEYEVLSDDFIEVIFEGALTTARRKAYFLKQNTINTPYPVISYFLTEVIEGYNVSIELSTRGENRNDYELPPLLTEFMRIPNPPDWANSPYDRTLLESYAIEEYKRNSRIYSIDIELRAGANIPVGNLKTVYSYASMFDLYFGFPLKDATKSIDLGLCFAFPGGRTPFRIYYHGEESEAKALTIVGFDLRYKKKFDLGKWLTIQPYSGIGFSSLGTDLYRKTVDDQDQNHEITALDMFGGANFTYKKLGLFFEYHFAPYNRSSRVDPDLGNQNIRTGVFFVF